jgi:hypothetical protein
MDFPVSNQKKAIINENDSLTLYKPTLKFLVSLNRPVTAIVSTQTAFSTFIFVYLRSTEKSFLRNSPCRADSYYRADMILRTS